MKQNAKRPKVYRPGAWTAFLWLLFLVSCTADEVPAYAPLEVSAEIKGIQSRATDKDATNYEKNQFVSGDRIKIVKSPDSSSGIYQRNTQGKCSLRMM